MSVCSKPVRLEVLDAVDKHLAAAAHLDSCLDLPEDLTEVPACGNTHLAGSGEEETIVHISLELRHGYDDLVSVQSLDVEVGLEVERGLKVWSHLDLPVSISL